VFTARYGLIPYIKQIRLTFKRLNLLKGQTSKPNAAPCPKRKYVCTIYKGKGNPVTGPGGPIGWVEVQLNSFLTSALGGGVWSASRPGRFYPRKRAGTHCTGGWVGPGAGLDRCGKSRPTGIRSPDLPASSESLYRLRCPGSHMRNLYPALYSHMQNTCTICAKIADSSQSTVW
jgi:hypothetical protein